MTTNYCAVYKALWLVILRRQVNTSTAGYGTDSTAAYGGSSTEPSRADTIRF